MIQALDLNRSNENVIKKRISLVEILLYIGIVTFLLFPLIRIFHIKTLPYFGINDPSEIANVAISIMAFALSKPIPDGVMDYSFKPVQGYENIGLEASIQYIPHFVFDDIIIVRVNLRWGPSIFKKYVTLESVVNKSHL